MYSKMVAPCVWVIKWLITHRILQYKIDTQPRTNVLKLKQGALKVKGEGFFIVLTTVIR